MVSLPCRCTLSGIVGSTAVVAVVGQRRIVVANCGDSRAVLSRAGVAVPLSTDHKVRCAGAHPQPKSPLSTLTKCVN